MRVTVAGQKNDRFAIEFAVDIVRRRIAERGVETLPPDDIEITNLRKAGTADNCQCHDDSLQAKIPAAFLR